MLPKSMLRNVEIKARIANLQTLLAKTAALADSGPEELCQDDTFFFCSNGRLKLRRLAPDSGELIFYQRSDALGPKASFYSIAASGDPGSLCEILTAAYGQAGRVQKQRTLFRAGRTRLHIDRVVGLGTFLEIEVVLGEEEEEQSGMREAREWMARLGIEESHLLSGSYFDLQGREGRKPGSEQAGADPESSGHPDR